MDLLQQLDELGHQVNEKFDSINRGGCAVFAVRVAKKLQAHGLKPKIFVCDACAGGNLEKVKKKIKNFRDHQEWADNGVYFGHVAVEFRYGGAKYHYDSDGHILANSKEFGGMTIYKGRLTIEEAAILAANRKAWNDEFDRRQIPKIQREIDKYFKPKKVKKALTK